MITAAAKTATIAGRVKMAGIFCETTCFAFSNRYQEIRFDGSVKSQNFDGFVKYSRSRLANPEE